MASLDVILPRQGIRFPSTCAACSAPASVEVRLFEYKPWDAVHVPVCAACRPKVFVGLVVRRLAVLSVATAGALAAQELFPGWLLSVFPAAEKARALFPLLWIVGALVTGVPVLALSVYVWPAAIDVSLDKVLVTFESHNAPWAEELRRLNRVPDDE